jgi:hypothetical protein
LADDSDTLEFLNSMCLNKLHHGIGRASKLMMIMELNEEIRLTIVDDLTCGRVE